MKNLLICLNGGCAFLNTFMLGHSETIPLGLIILAVVAFSVNTLGIVVLSSTGEEFSTGADAEIKF